VIGDSQRRSELEGKQIDILFALDKVLQQSVLSKMFAQVTRKGVASVCLKKELNICKTLKLREVPKA
jgi:hypothetical protein